MASIVSAPSTSSLRLSSPFRALSPPFSSPCTAARRLHFRRSIQPTSLRPVARRLRSPAGVLTFRCSAVTTIGQSDFPAEVLSSDVPVLVEFVADWCGPCRLISPIVEWASQEYKEKLKIVKIDHDANPELIQEYKVYGLPCLIFFKNGQQVPESRREGAISKAKLKEYLDSLLGSTSVV